MAETKVIVGAVVGSVAGLILIILLIFLVMKLRKKRKTEGKYNPQNMEMSDQKKINVNTITQPGNTERLI